MTLLLQKHTYRRWRQEDGVCSQLFCFFKYGEGVNQLPGCVSFFVFLVLQENCKGRRLPWDFTVECVGAGAIV